MHPREPHLPVLPVLLVGAVLFFAACSPDSGGPTTPDKQREPSHTDEERAAMVVAVEEAIQEVTPLLSFGAALAPTGDALPPWLTGDVPSSARLAQDPGSFIDKEPTASCETMDWPITSEDAPMTLPPWPGARALMAKWEAPKFGILRGAFTEGTTGDLLLDTKFEAGAEGHDGLRYGVKASQRITWRKAADEGWRIVHWEQQGFKVLRARHRFFEEVLDQALPDSWARENARRSAQEEVTESALREGRLRVPKAEYADLPDMENAYQYPAVSVVDYDADGYDDLFLTTRIGFPQLLRNRGDATFEDVTARAGLRVENSVNCALFADFDNDGDPDLLLGRALEPSLYFVNDGGRFRDRTADLTDLGAQFLVSSMAAADVNRDGLLDVYLTTYSPGTDVLPVWKERYLLPGQGEKLDALQRDAHPYLDDRGAPNVLLMNRGGGRLERAGGEAVTLWRKSYQPVWADVDNDGDDDLYVCNDFAPDTLLRNDTPPGDPEPVFTEAFGRFFPDGKMAFGMGASFADQDNDGDLDLFVSNMYSKAGNRIIAMAGGADPRIAVAAQGNFLYRNEAGTFRQIEEDSRPEAHVGWAFGGQFADFDNDGRLDLYVPSGYYSAPESVATTKDL